MPQPTSVTPPPGLAMKGHLGKIACPYGFPGLQPWAQRFLRC